MKKMAFGLVLGMLIVGAAVFAQNVGTGPARVVSYQGTLELDGTAAEGAYEMTFFLVFEEAADSGSAIWSETHPVVLVNSGTFSVGLGETTELTSTVLARPNLFVGVIVNGTELTGKQRLRPVAYSIESNGTPPGTVIAFAGSAVPDGWLICDGSAVGPTDYPRLFDAIGMTYGAANGGLFRLPDLRGRMPLGLDNQGGSSANRVVNATADVLGGTSGTERTTGVAAHTHGLQSDGLHDHTMPDSCNAGTQCGGVGDGFVRGPRNTNVDFWLGDSGAHDHGGATLSAGASSVDNMPPYMGMRYLIKY